MKRKILLSIIASLTLGLGLTGCKGGNDNSSISNTSTTASVKASDAYVVALNTPAKLTLSDGTAIYSTKVEANGTIVFDVPVGTDLTNSTVEIPDDAIVDADGDGQFSPSDQVIRTALLTKFVNNTTQVIANPTTTAILLKDPDLKNPDSLNALKEAVKQDPVKLKDEAVQELVNNVLSGQDVSVDNLKPLKLAAYNDGMAYIYKLAKDLKEKLVQYNIKIDEKVTAQNIIDNIDVVKMLDEVNNEGITYTTFLTDYKTEIQNAVNNYKTKLLEEKDLANEVITSINNEFDNQINKIIDKLNGEKELLVKAKEKLMEEINEINEETKEQKEKLKNEIKEKLKKMLILTSDTEIEPEKLLNTVTTKGIAKLDMTDIISIVPKVSTVEKKYEQYKKELKEKEMNKNDNNQITTTSDQPSETTENYNSMMLPTPPAIPSLGEVSDEHKQETKTSTETTVENEKNKEINTNNTTVTNTKTTLF